MVNQNPTRRPSINHNTTNTRTYKFDTHYVLDIVKKSLPTGECIFTMDVHIIVRMPLVFRVP